MQDDGVGGEGEMGPVQRDQQDEEEAVSGGHGRGEEEGESDQVRGQHNEGRHLRDRGLPAEYQLALKCNI